MPHPLRRPTMSRSRPQPYRPHPMRLRQSSRKPNPKHSHDFKTKYGLARIKSVQDARGCLCLVKCENDTAATIDIVEVIGQGGKPSAFKITQCILEYYTRNITALKLLLSFEPTPQMLQNLAFTSLSIFTTNIPHALIAPFLTRHTAITDLTLDVCNTATAATAMACPLTSCMLPCIRQLTCPKGCVRPLLSAVTPASPLYNLQVIQHASQDSSFPLLDLFDSRPIPTSSDLCFLHVDYDHITRRLLQAISKAAPKLDTLRLAESNFFDREEIPLRDDMSTWDFQSFGHLKRLLIQTRHSISLLPSSLSLLPSSLTEVRIWTKAFSGHTNGERLAIWRKNVVSKRWEVTFNPSVEGEEVSWGDLI